MLYQNKIILRFNEEQKEKLDFLLKELNFIFVKLWQIKAVNSWVLSDFSEYNKGLLEKINNNIDYLINNTKCDVDLLNLKTNINNDFNTFFNDISIFNNNWFYFTRGWIYIENKKIASILYQCSRKVLIKFNNFSDFEFLNNMIFTKVKADLFKYTVSIEYREEETKLLYLLSKKSLSVYNMYRIQRKNNKYSVKIYKQLNFSLYMFFNFLYNKYKNKDDRILEELKKMM